jgi:hypothetical protein
MNWRGSNWIVALGWIVWFCCVDGAVAEIEDQPKPKQAANAPPAKKKGPEPEYIKAIPIETPKSALERDSTVESTSPAPPAREAIRDERIASSIDHGIRILLSMQEGEGRAEWPYEGVYRVGGEIPIGYRVGGTSICAMALMESPGFDRHAERQSAVRRALAFVLKAQGHRLMAPRYAGKYDVRGWGYAYALPFLLKMKESREFPPGAVDRVEQAIRFYIDAIEKTELEGVGGWNYAQRSHEGTNQRRSPFMTAPTLLALYDAKRMGYEVDRGVVDRALNALEGARTKEGTFVYSGTAGKAGKRAAVQGSIGRMPVSEVALLLAGRSSVDRVRSAVDAFIEHWQWLDDRRAKDGTHKPPYGVAPYYFYYAHRYAALAVEMLPESDRPARRRQINELLFSVQLDDGRWNDRVFSRSANFGTAMSMMALMSPDMEKPASWSR